MAFIITFNVESSRTATFVNSVKALGDWVPLTPTSFLVKPTVPLKGIMEALQPMLGPKDDLWVIGAMAPWTAYGDPIAEDHVETELGEPFGDWIPRDWEEETQSRP